MFAFEYEGKLYSKENFDLMQSLIERWDKLHQTNIFRYKLDNLRERVIGNAYVLQLNCDRSVKRRLPEQITDIQQPFDKNKFNFTKVSEDEILFKFWDTLDKATIHTVLINVSPINQYHSLLCPYVNRMLPQVVSLESLKLVLDVYTMAQHRDLRIAFNSLCALASVNHLHYHIIMEKQNLPVESAECRKIKGPVWITEGYPIPAFCFNACSKGAAQNIFKLIHYFLDNSIAHNIFITRGSSFDGEGEITRVFIWARKSTAGAKQLSAFNVAALELSGLFAVYSMEHFDSLDTKDLERELVKWKVDNLEQLCREIADLY
ncbi:unnamed protein product [Leptosia nina]|uniref:GDP-D-glucose phosphorylase 1 n=1 Tax=Leptosia nina TaxID=320188 RepID=A0AAV1J2J9_9NEOP